MVNTNKRKPQYYASPTWTNPAFIEASVEDSELDYSFAQWEDDCFHWRGQMLTGKYAHWCPQWGNLPMDETCPEWPCNCDIEAVLPQNPSPHDE